MRSRRPSMSGRLWWLAMAVSSLACPAPVHVRSCPKPCPSAVSPPPRAMLLNRESSSCSLYIAFSPLARSAVAPGSLGLMVLTSSSARLRFPQLRQHRSPGRAEAPFPAARAVLCFCLLLDEVPLSNLLQLLLAVPPIGGVDVVVTVHVLYVLPCRWCPLSYTSCRQRNGRPLAGRVWVCPYLWVPIVSIACSTSRQPWRRCGPSA